MEGPLNSSITTIGNSNMNSRKLATLATLATVGLLATTALASAANVPAVATGNVNVRTGPGVGFNKVDVLYTGEHVSVRECNSGWCYVQHSGPDGWVSANYLANPPSSGGSGGSSRPPVNFGLTFGPGGPTFSISVGNAPPPAPAPAPAAKVCFYKGANYTGSSVCVTAGSTNNHLSPGWNNKISSLRVYGGASVQICRNYNYGGGCKNYSHNVAVLPFAYNNTVSSYQTWF